MPARGSYSRINPVSLPQREQLFDKGIEHLFWGRLRGWRHTHTRLPNGAAGTTLQSRVDATPMSVPPRRSRCSPTCAVMTR